MTSDEFLSSFGHFIDAPIGFQKLRELILQLAVQGKLVAQDQSDQPASSLFEKINTEEARLAKAGAIRVARRRLAPIRDTEKPFDIPETWCWVRVNDIGHQWGQKTPDRDFTYIDVSAINKDKGIVEAPNVLRRDQAPSRARKVVRPGTVIFSTVRPYLLNVAVIESEFEPEPIASTAFAVIHPFCEIPGRYIYIYLRSPSFIQYVESIQTGIAYPAINDGQFYGGLFPLPPLAEQHRIVAKVDELMALCDQLEAERNARDATHTRLIRAVHHPLTEASDAASTATAWRRIRNHFADLYTTRESVQSLRQTILQLAVQGKLVAQDPNDEPASALLERSQRQTETKRASGQLRRQKKLPPLDPENAPFELPDGWVWARFPELGTFGRGKSKHRPRNDPALYRNGTIPLVQTGDVARANGVISTCTARYNEKGLQQSQLWPAGTMCITIAANIADTGILSIDSCFPDSVVGFIPYSEIGNTRYFEYFTRTAKDRLLDFAPSTAQKNINLAILETVMVPLPPANEIARIVAKVDELMALCDQLDAAITSRDATASRYAEAVVRQLSAA